MRMLGTGRIKTTGTDAKSWGAFLASGVAVVVALSLGGSARAGSQASLETPVALGETPVDVRFVEIESAVPGDSITSPSITSPGPRSFSQLTSLESLPAVSNAPLSDVGISDLPSDQHPMVPLPPAVWAGLGTLAFVAWHAIRQQRGVGQRH